MSYITPQPPDPPPTGQAEGPYVVRAQFKLRLSPPYVTRALLVIIVAVFAAMVVYGYVAYGTVQGTEDMRVLVIFGAKVNGLIAQGQTWRLFTAMFIHIGVLHLLFNLYALYIFGPLVEGYYGHLRFLAIYLLAGLFGSFASYAFSPVPSAGASGAIFGLAGAIIVYFLRYRENFGARGRAILQNMLLIIGINLVFGMTAQGIDNWGHIGGLVGGALVAYGLLPRYKAPAVLVPGPQVIEQEDRSVQSLLWVGVCVVILVLGVEFVTRTIYGAG